MEALTDFAGIGPKYSAYKTSKVVILPLPYDLTASYMKGAAGGPAAIIEASPQLEWYDEEIDKEIYKSTGICTLEPLGITRQKPEEMARTVEKKTLQLLDDNKFVVGIGGEHSVSVGIVAAYKKKFGDFSVLQLDAHSDLRETYENSAYNHACVMKRIIDMGIKAVQVGIRATENDSYKELVKQDRTKIFFAKDLWQNDRWIKDAVASLSRNVYITIDVDVFDPSIMPSTGTPEPGGMQWYPALALLREVAKQKNVIGFDVVELMPIKGIHFPEFSCARLIYKLIGYIFENKV